VQQRLVSLSLILANYILFQQLMVQVAKYGPFNGRASISTFERDLMLERQRIAIGLKPRKPQNVILVL